MMKEKWIIKAGFPNSEEKIHWSDYAFGNLLKKQLEKLDIEVSLESREEWYEDREADVVVVLRGYLPFYRKRREDKCVYLLWNLSHPDTVTMEEYESYDLVCVSSETYAAQLRERITAPIEVVPMCVDTEVFCPPKKVVERVHELVFVGNTRNVKRESVMYALEAGLPLELWGDGWKALIPEYEDHIAGTFLANERIPQLYYQSKLTVNDHFADMRAKGFINTRILEALACGLPIMSDYSEYLEEMFGDCIIYYKDKEDYVRKYEEVMANYDEVLARTSKAWTLIRDHYSFAAVAKRLKDLARESANKGYKGNIPEELIVNLYREKQAVTLEKSDSVKKYRQVVKERDELKAALKKAVITDKRVKGLYDYPYQDQIDSFFEMINREKRIVDCELVQSGNEVPNPKVSIILPVYNSEEYLAECMGSIAGQSFDDYEVICIDDGSTDQSLELLCKQCEGDGRYRIYREKNAGPGSARNQGLAKAKGEYICFVDADDRLKPNALEILYQKAKGLDAEVVYFDGEGFRDEHNYSDGFDHLLNHYKRSGDYPESCSGKELLIKMREAGEYRVNVYLQFMKRSFLEREGIRFVNGIIHEDQSFSTEAALLAKRVAYIRDALYERRVRKNSIMTGATDLEHLYGYYRMILEILPYMDRDIGEDGKAIIWHILKGLRRNMQNYFEKLSNKEKNLFDKLEEFDRERFYHILAGPRRRAHVVQPDEVGVLRGAAEELADTKKELEKIKKSKAYRWSLKVVTPLRNVRKKKK